MDDQQYDNVRLNEVIHHSGLESLVNNFSDGVHKIISENGRNISGGQRQRIAIARALYKNADLIILDEPFNELDQAAELILLRYLQFLSENGKMIILITHNAESLAYCNHIISIDSYA
jgi:ABC-type bacteriocin/lantibiotic exporter with double-glycine peptidase domain